MAERTSAAFSDHPTPKPFWTTAHCGLAALLQLRKSWENAGQGMDAALALIPLIEAACTVAAYQPVSKRRNHKVDIESAHAFDPKYLEAPRTELERAEKLTGESGAPSIQPRHQARIGPRDVDLIGGRGRIFVFNAINVETTASSSSDQHERIALTGTP